MSSQQEALGITVLKGHDTAEFLEHIAWEELILPALRADQKIISEQLVGAVLGTAKSAESQHQLAGKVWGIEWTIKRIEEFVREGERAREALAQRNLFVDM